MSTTDGTILGPAVQIYGTAPLPYAGNAVLLADGFTEAEQAAFNSACQTFVNILLATKPFTDLHGAINVFRVNVASAESGADDPASAGGTGAVVRTYFDATFGAGGIRRLLVCNQTTARLVAAEYVPAYSSGAVFVVVNSPIYGGSGGRVSVFSLAPGANDISVHEYGHTSRAGLADEYAALTGVVQPGQEHHPPVEPRAPNVTIATTWADLRAAGKWAWAIESGTPLPTMVNPDCTQLDPRPSPMPPGFVGLFGGGNYYPCDVYRPEHTCKMKALGFPFCRVCQQAIWNQFGPLATPGLQERTAVLSAPLLASAPTAGVLPRHVLSTLAYRGIRNDLYALAREASGSESWRALTAETGCRRAQGQPWLHIDTDREEHVLLYRDTLGELQRLVWQTGAVVHTALASQARLPPAAGDPVSCYVPATHTHQVVYRTTDGALQALTWQGDDAVRAAGTWGSRQGCPPAVGQPALAVQGATTFLTYHAAGGHLQGLTWRAAGITCQLLTTSTTKTVSDPWVFTVAPQDTPHIVYRGAQGQLWLLTWAGSEVLTRQNLTAAAGAPPAVGRPTGYHCPDTESLHVGYRTGDGGMHEIWWRHGSSVAPLHVDLSATTGATLNAVLNPVGYTVLGATGLHLAYKSSDGRLWEMRRGLG